MEPVSTKKFLRTWLWALTIVSLLAILQTIQRTNELEIALFRSKWIGLVGVFAFTAMVGIWLSFSSFLSYIADWLAKRETQSANGSRFALCVFLLE